MLWKKTIIMLIAFAVLTLAAIAGSVFPGGGEGPQLDLPPLEKDRISRIEVTNVDQPVILEKTEDGWKLQPAGHKVDESAIDRALSTLDGLSAGTMISKSAANHEKYGVSAKDMILTVSTRDTKTWKLIIGNESADKRGNYVREPGDKRVFVSSKRIQSLFNTEPNRWRDRVVAKFDHDQATRLTLTYHGQTLSFTKSDTGEWGFDPKPENLPSDFLLGSANVDQVVRALSNLRASDFEDNVTSLKEMGLEPPVASVKVDLAEGDSIAIDLGNDRDKKTIAVRRDDDQVYLLSEYSVKKITQTWEDFRDLHVAKFDMEKATRMEIDQQGNKLVFEKEKDWKLVESSETVPVDFRLDPKKVETLARSASRFQGKSLVGTKASAGAGLNQPQGILRVTLDDGTTKKITVGKETGDKEVYVSGDRGAVFVASKYGAERLIPGLDNFKVTAKRQQPMISPEALKNLPPEVAQQLMQKQRQEIMQKQLIQQMMKQQEAQKGEK